MAANKSSKGFAVFGCLVAVVLGLSIAYIVSTRGVDNIGHSQFGTVEIPLGSGKVIYARREVRGLNYDVLALSPDSNTCAHANPQTDIIFRYDGTPLYLTRNRVGVAVYRYGSVEIPRSAPSLTGIEVEQVNFTDFKSLEKTYQQLHIRKLEVPVTSGSCTSHR